MRLFAKFHDIGKVGISDAILFKPVLKRRGGAGGDAPA
jgi:response regulator RpfG family c-di-GMP phosphodiesterase